MTIEQWGILTSIIVAIAGLFAWGIKWTIKHYLAELKPNGGGSMRDSVNVNTERLNRVEQRVDDIYRMLCERE